MSSLEAPSSSVDLLILGAGWTSTFLIPLLRERGISYAATTRDGRDGTIQFAFDPTSDDSQAFEKLPGAKTVLITFPIYGEGGSTRLVKLYSDVHSGTATNFVQLGSTGIYDGTPTLRGEKEDPIWSDRHSSYNKENKRAIAEDELLSLSDSFAVTVLELCGLWGGQRSMRKWVGKVAPSKEVLKNKGSIHLIHGFDVARGILAVHERFDLARGTRWILTDGRVYDWWDLASAWGSGGIDSGPVPEGPQPQWVRELMEEHNVRALPRSPEVLGRALDSREFWSTFGLSPAKARVEGVS